MTSHPPPHVTVIAGPGGGRKYHSNLGPTSLDSSELSPLKRRHQAPRCGNAAGHRWAGGAGNRGRENLPEPGSEVPKLPSEASSGSMGLQAWPLEQLVLPAPREVVAVSQSDAQFTCWGPATGPLLRASLDPCSERASEKPRATCSLPPFPCVCASSSTKSSLLFLSRLF